MRENCNPPKYEPLRRMAVEFINHIQKPYNAPSGNWSDFNTLYKNRLGLINISKFEPQQGFLCNNDIPQEPDPTNYPNN